MKKKLSYLIYFLIINCISVSVLAQKKVEFDFRYALPDNISYNEGLKIALGKAKKEALVEGNITENFMTYTSFSRSGNNHDLKKIFNSDMFSNMTGTIKSWEYISGPDKIFDSELNAYYIKFRFSAKVIKYDSKPDAQFVIKIDGVLPSYKSNPKNINDKNLKIKINPSKDCYLKVFYVDDEEAKIIYPIEVQDGIEEYEVFKNKMILANEIFNIDYISPFTDKETENGKLIFVITKKNYTYPYSQADENGLFTETFTDKIFQWYMNIEPEEKNIVYKQFSIYR